MQTHHKDRSRSVLKVLRKNYEMSGTTLAIVDVSISDFTTSSKKRCISILSGIRSLTYANAFHPSNTAHMHLFQIKYYAGSVPQVPTELEPEETSPRLTEA